MLDGEVVEPDIGIARRIEVEGGLPAGLEQEGALSLQPLPPSPPDEVPTAGGAAKSGNKGNPRDSKEILAWKELWQFSAKGFTDMQGRFERADIETGGRTVERGALYLKTPNMGKWTYGNGDQVTLAGFNTSIAKIIDSEVHRDGTSELPMVVMAQILLSNFNLLSSLFDLHCVSMNRGKCSASPIYYQFKQKRLKLRLTPKVLKTGALESKMDSDLNISSIDMESLSPSRTLVTMRYNDVPATETTIEVQVVDRNLGMSETMFSRCGTASLVAAAVVT